MESKSVKRIRLLSETPPWTGLTLTGLALLAAVDALRRAGLAGDSVLLGSLPNLVAVPVLTFGVLMLRYPQRRPVRGIARLFAWTLGIVLVLVLAWEGLQRTGNLVFDPNDLVATVLGAFLTLALYPLIRRSVLEEVS